MPGGGPDCSSTRETSLLIRRSLAATAAGALLISLAPGLSASAAEPKLDLQPVTGDGGSVSRERGTVISLGDGPGRELYVVRLDAPAVPTRERADKPPGRRRPPSGPTGRARREQADLVASIAQVTGAPAKVRFRYTEAVNGIAVELTRAAGAEGLADRRRRRRPGRLRASAQTDRGPEWIGAPTIWDGSQRPRGLRRQQGRGRHRRHPRLRPQPGQPVLRGHGARGGRRRRLRPHQPARPGNYLGICDPANAQYVANWGCNDKLIGYYDFEDPVAGGNPFDDAYDDDGHGSHTGSTTAGNQVDGHGLRAEGTGRRVSVTSTIKGVAPHANIIGYDVCDGGCQGYLDPRRPSTRRSSTTSTSSTTRSARAPPSQARGPTPTRSRFLNARAAGIHVATSAGNDGPGAATARQPRRRAVDDRRSARPRTTASGVASVTEHHRDRRRPPCPTSRARLRQVRPTVRYPVVDAGAHRTAARRCDLPAPTSSSRPAPTSPARSSSATAAATAASRRARIVADARRRGHDPGQRRRPAATRSTVTRTPSRPSHITYADGAALKACMAGHPGTEAALSGAVEVHRPRPSATSWPPSPAAVPTVRCRRSARPSRLPAWTSSPPPARTTSVEWHFISGTSMASPHTAGALALLKAAVPARDVDARPRRSPR